VNWTRRVVAGHPVKLISSCVRRASPLLDGTQMLAPFSPAPRDGDLVLVRALDGCGAYDHVEDETGAPVKLYRGDVFVAVLGTRRSGTNLMGEVPKDPLQAGDRIDLVAQGGLAARCVAVPAYYGSRALPLEVVGFPAELAGRVVNLDHAPVVEVREARSPMTGKPVLFVAGTSAEVGKTTLVCRLNGALKQYRPGIVTSAIKGCGTGRAKDVLNYRAANYDVVTDFVDAGMPSTYGVAPQRFRAMLHTLIEHCAERADVVVVEIGGDFLEAQAPEALKIMAELGAHCVMMVNDAMGALEGLRRLHELGREPLMIGTFKQNLHALADRLEVPAERVINSADDDALHRLVVEFLRDISDAPDGDEPVPVEAVSGSSGERS
jgi:nucleoside-triphosphatase THEP1